MTKYAGRGLTIEMDASPLGQVTSLGAFGSSRDLIDASAYGDDWKDWLVGQQDGTEVSMVIALDPVDSGHDAIVTAYNSAPDTPVTFTFTHADSGGEWDVTAILTQLEIEAALSGMLQMSVTAKIVNPGVVSMGS